jgi:hypothetical protein
MGVVHGDEGESDGETGRRALRDAKSAEQEEEKWLKRGVPRR